VRERKQSAARPGVVGSVAGLTPAMIALVTLGACCSTTAAATAGVGLVAQASGSSLNNLLLNDWYLDVFQVTVVFVALIAQELLLRVYGGLFGLDAPPGDVERPRARPAPMGARLIAGGALRAALLLGGVTWSLAMVAEWTTISPWTATPTLWFQWIFQHQVVAVVAILVALFPGALFSGVRRWANSPWTYSLRAALLVGGLSLVAWVPPAVAGGGAGGLVNELFGVWGLPAAWGAVAPAYSPGIALFLRWGLQYLLLGGFAVALAVAPERALRPLLWTLEDSDSTDTPSGEVRPVPSPGSAGSAYDGPRAMRSDPPTSARGIQDP